MFGANLVQALAQDCTFYSESVESKIAMAICKENGDTFFASGELDGAALTRVTLLGGAADYNHGRLTPEGDELWVERGALGLSVYRRGESSTWTYTREISLPGMVQGAGDALAAPSRVIDGRRHVMVYSFGDRLLREYVDDGSVTTFVASYDPGALHALYIVFPNMTADGLRLVFNGELDSNSVGPGTMYAERTSVTDLFGPAIRLGSAPAALDPYLREDCSRLYSWGLSSVFFAPQRQ